MCNEHVVSLNIANLTGSKTGCYPLEDCQKSVHGLVKFLNERSCEDLSKDPLRSSKILANYVLHYIQTFKANYVVAQRIHL